MRNNGPSSDHPRILTVALTLSLLLPAAAVLTADEVSSQEGCLDLPTEPIWIPEVDFYNTTGNQRDLFEDGAVFVDKSTEDRRIKIEVSITVENRVEDPSCRNVQSEDLSNVQAKIAYPVGGSGWETMDRGGRTCNLETDDRCTFIHQEITIPSGPDVPAGEHRIFIVAGNGDSPFTPYAGAERVIVVDQRPDLVITEVSEPDDATTTYNDPGATSQFDVTIENHGDYPAWNPNGGTHWSDRSSFDAPYIPEDDHEQGWGEPDPWDYTPEESDESAGSHGGGEGQLPGCNVDEDDPQAPPAPSGNWDGWSEELNCSYRYGTDMPLQLRYNVHQLNPEDIDIRRFSVVLETGLVEDGLATTTDDSGYDDIDKDAARLLPQFRHFIAPGHSDNIPNQDFNPANYTFTKEDVQAVELNGKAGLMHVNWTVDRDLDNASLVPERNLTDPTTEERNRVDLGELNNNATVRFKILGPDLVFDTHDQGGPSDINDDDSNDRGGAPQVSNALNPGCGAQENPCQPGSGIDVQFGWMNTGDWPPEGTSPSDAQREWRVAVYLNGQLADCDDCGDGDKAVQNISSIPAARDGQTQVQTGGWTIPSLSGGGTHVIEVRLDDGALYQDNRLDEHYKRVAEYNETNTCQPGSIDLDDELGLYNRYCITLAFEDTEPPQISDLELDPLPGENEVSTPEEGELITFNATVEDPSTDEVRAIIETPDGDPVANVSMAEVGEHTDLYQVQRRILGQQANNTSMEDPDDVIYLPEDLSDLSGGLDLVYRVWANDTFGHASTAPDTDVVELTLEELPKEIDVVEFAFNGETNPNEEDAPTYEGTADDPENVFNLTAMISGDGRPDTVPEDPENERADPTGKVVEVYDNRGELRYTLDMQAMKVCTEEAAAGQGETTVYGNDCSTSEGDDPLDQISNVHWQFYVDTSKEGHDQWGNVTLDWAGDWSVNVTVEDVNNRTGEVDRPARFNDKDDEAEITDPILAPLELDPGASTTASAFVTDALRVEEVFLNVTHQGSGDTFKLSLGEEPAVRAQDGEAGENSQVTDNGTYQRSFLAGAGGDFSKAGSYDVDLVAIDFALKENSTDLGQLVVNDTDDPVIRQFFTLPEGGVQEVGGNVTWQARIEDSTEIQTPALDVTFPAQDPKTIELEHNETTGLWEANLSVPASEIGIWEYELTVEDYAGHVVSETGEIEIKQSRPPQAQANSWKPSTIGTDGSTIYGPAQPTIEVDIVDFSDGVNLSSVNMTVNGDEVDFQATPIPNGFALSHAVDSAFSDGDSVTVMVTAADNSGLANDAPLAHSFVVDATGPSAIFEADPAEEDDTRQIIGETSEITVAVEDAGSGPGTLTVTVQHLAGTTATAEETLTFEDGNGTFRFSDLEQAFQGHGDYRLILTPVDAVGNEGSQINKQVLFDKSPPKVQVFAKPGQPREQVFADVNDEATVTEAWVLYTPEGEEEERLDLQLVNGTWEGRIPAFPRNTTINFTVKAEDLFGNIGSSPEDSFEAGDAVPTISLSTPSDGDVVSGTTELAWTASDLETESSQLKVSLYYKRPGQDFKPIPDAQDIDNQGRYNLDTTILPNGELTLQAIVFDGNNFGDSKVTVTVRNLASIFNDPQLEGAERADGKNQVEPGEEVVFSVQIDGTVQAAVANVTDQQGNVLESVTLEADGQGNWKGTFMAPTDPGDYNIDLIAQTSDGPVETENAYTFSVQGAGGEDSKSFVSEWTILSILFAGAVAVGALGLTQRWN